ncbi:DUF928 domain-containing protein [Scytonema sp. PRP1]|uniref:DUF928 domain-containing protein n=1 Tax=Scytonema sp. PRP1 TaxID=3120513 RepID=UPI002FD57CE7
MSSFGKLCPIFSSAVGTLAISWAVLSCTQMHAQSVNSLVIGQSSTVNPRGQLNQSLIFAAPPPPPDIGEPGQRAEAGSRGCGGGNKQLTALMPVYSNSQLIFGATTASHPTFWFYIPYKPPSPGKFVLQDKDDNLVYQTDVTLPQTPGVISFSLPQTVAPLLIGKRYHWFFKIYCKAQQPSAFVEGWIQRNSLNPALNSQLEKATPRERVALYAANGIWFEALTTAGELRRRDPKETSWATLLQAVGLNDLANEPITP